MGRDEVSEHGQNHAPEHGPVQGLVLGPDHVLDHGHDDGGDDLRIRPLKISEDSEGVCCRPLKCPYPDSPFRPLKSAAAFEERTDP
ncbi:MAG: hypothetical protein LBT62_01760 [Deltaproteobacteria bacterium]|nr:hypothetical protein [Deltaproteobacteria bacterium]